MGIWVVRNGELIQYERMGKCLGCGDCCRKFDYAFSYIGPQKKSEVEAEKEGKEVLWGDWEGWAIEDWDDNEYWTWWGPLEIIPLENPKCRHFDPKTNLCAKFRKEDWREICRKFPLRPEDLKGLGNCGFSFRRVP